MNVLDNFRLADEREDFNKVVANIYKGIDFKGTNLWILIFAIFIASLGLNINSTAVIIGAMLISPLMGPIIGLGFGMAVNDLSLLRKSFFAYLFTTGICLVTSTLFFLLSPIDEAYSELLARTSPSVYDVLIALFGGLAGMLAASSKLKGNVIPGVAIATALMPALCTAGYGFANLKPEFLFGALYLYVINSVFIALSTLITGRLLKFPLRELLEESEEIRTKRIVYAIVLVTTLPSLYFGYDMVRQNKYMKNANDFVEKEAILPNDYLLKVEIDPKNETILLVYGGDIVAEGEIEELKGKLDNYNLNATELIVQQGFAYLQQNDEVESQLAIALNEKERKVRNLQMRLDSLESNNDLSNQVFRELKIYYPSVSSLVLQPAYSVSSDSVELIWVSSISSLDTLNNEIKTNIGEWLKVRVNTKRLEIMFNP